MSAKPPLFFIHGMWSQPKVWDRFRAHFEPLGYDCHAPALPGHDVAPSDPVPTMLAGASLKDYVDALEIDARKCSEAPIIIGHSLGGLLAQLLAVRVQPRALVLLSTAPSASVFALSYEPLKSLWPIAKQWGYWTRATLMPPAAAMYGIFNNVPQDEAEAELKSLVHDSGRVLFQLSMPWFDKARGGFVDYAKLMMPTLVVCGDADRITPIGLSRRTARKLGGKVSFKEMEDFGHWIIGRQGAPIVSRHMDDFIAAL
jgi:pimeloyl-ACP methyl ester carboxylesterase